MKIDIEEKSIEIQNLISIYTKESFVCFFADFIRHHSIRSQDGFVNKLKSKLKDSLYLIMLRLSSKEAGEEELIYSDESNKVLEKVADILLEIITFYLSGGHPLDSVEIKDTKKEAMIHELVFKDFFENGVLSYREQEINKTIRLFKVYEDKIHEKLNIKLRTLLEIFDFSEELYINKSIKNNSFIQSDHFIKFAKKLASNKNEKIDFEKELLELPENIQDDFLNYNERPYATLLFTKEEYYKHFEVHDVDVFCDLFSLDISDKCDHKFYAQSNPLELKPIIKINKKEYLNVYQKQLPTALYSLLYNMFTSTKKEKEQLNHRRGKIVFENQVFELFQRFFKGSKFSSFFRNYYINDCINEKDILIIVNRVAYIIECKASRNQEPRRSFDQAYRNIRSDFRESIQKGYDQCYQVEKEILKEKELVIRQGTETIVIDTSEINECFSIVVTLERFASIQTDLGLLLKKENSEVVYPWSVYIDDLEIFLQTLKMQFNNSERKFREYLEYRELLNERVFSRDELDVCASYLKNQKKFKELCEDEEIFIVTDLHLQGYFDQLYFNKKLKFKILEI